MTLRLEDALGFVVGPRIRDPSLTAGSDEIPGRVVAAGQAAFFPDTYGYGDGVTPDSTAVLAAMAAASAAGRGTVRLGAGNTYKLAGVTPLSGVTIDAYGATIITDPAVSNQGPFWTTNTTPPQVTDFGIFGATFAGTGAETTNQQPVLIRNGLGIRIQDCKVTNWPVGSFYIQDSTDVWVLCNQFDTVGVPFGQNTINIVQQNGNVANNIVAGNIITNCATIPIDVVLVVGGNQGSASNPVVDRVTIADNIVHTTSSSGWGIGVENGGNSYARRIKIHGNTVYVTGAAIGIVVTNDAASPSTDALLHQGLDVSANTISGPSSSTPALLVTQLSYSQVRGNIVVRTGTGSGIEARMAGGSAPQLRQLAIADNLISMPANGGAGINALHMLHGKISGNIIEYPTGSTTGSHGLQVQNSSRPKIRGNDIEFSPQSGISIAGTDSPQVTGNDITNPNEIGAAWRGIGVSTWTAAPLIQSNSIIDNRGTHLMTYGIWSDAAGLPTIGNIIGGAATAPTLNTTTIAGV